MQRSDSEELLAADEQPETTYLEVEEHATVQQWLSAVPRPHTVGQEATAVAYPVNGVDYLRYDLDALPGREPPPDGWQTGALRCYSSDTFRAFVEWARKTPNVDIDDDDIERLKEKQEARLGPSPELTAECVEAEFEESVDHLEKVVRRWNSLLVQSVGHVLSGPWFTGVGIYRRADG